jgi:hypothetical protein
LDAIIAPLALKITSLNIKTYIQPPQFKTVFPACTSFIVKGVRTLDPALFWPPVRQFLPNLTTLDVTGIPIVPANLNALFQPLTSFHCEYSQVVTVEFIRDTYQAVFQQGISLKECSILFSQPIVAAIPAFDPVNIQCTHLEKLCLQGPAPPSFHYTLAKKCPTLRSVRINSISNTDFADLCQSTSLSALYIETGCNITTFSPLVTCPNLKVVWIDDQCAIKLTVTTVASFGKALRVYVVRRLESDPDIIVQIENSFVLRAVDVEELAVTFFEGLIDWGNATRRIYQITGTKKS